MTRFRGFRLLSGVLAVVATLSLAPTPAEAQFGFGGIVYDPTNFARNVLHYQRRLEQIRMQQQQLQQQITAMRKLASPTWRQIGPLVAQVDAVIQQGQSLAFSLATIDAQFRQTFPGSQVFQNYPAEQQNQALRTLATMRGALNAANTVVGDVQAGLSRLATMKTQLARITGHEEAIELNGTIGVFSAEELMLLRQAIAAQTNAQTVYFASQINAEAQRTATVRAQLLAMSAPGPQYPPVSLTVVP